MPKHGTFPMCDVPWKNSHNMGFVSWEFRAVANVLSRDMTTYFLTKMVTNLAGSSQAWHRFKAKVAQNSDCGDFSPSCSIKRLSAKIALNNFQLLSLLSDRGRTVRTATLGSRLLYTATFGPRSLNEATFGQCAFIVRSKSNLFAIQCHEDLVLGSGLVLGLGLIFPCTGTSNRFRWSVIKPFFLYLRFFLFRFFFL